MKKIKLLPLTSALLITLNSQAQNNSEIYQQQKTVVTASRYQQDKDDVIASVSVIDREDILNLQATSIVDLLSLQQGIDVGRNGGNGSATSIFMRGTNSNHVLVLIDGMRVGSAFTGSFAWEHLPVSQIQRIEIVRGTRVSFYGADAIGGVINIITRKQENLYASYTTGSFDTHNFDLAYGGSTQNSQFSIVLGSQKTDGFSATNENNLFGFNPDDDGYENLSLNLKGSMSLENGDVSFNYLETKSDSDFDSFYNEGNSDNKERVVRVAWNGVLFNDWQSEISLGNNKNSLKTKIYLNGFDSNRYSFDWLINKQIQDSHLGFGFNYRKEDFVFDSRVLDSFDLDGSRNNAAAFANWQGVIDKNIYSLSARFDHNNIYGNDASGSIDWAYKLNNDMRFNLSVGTAFHAPNLNELYSNAGSDFIFSPELDRFVGLFAIEGNLDLKPEESINYEAGFKAKLSDTQDLAVNIYYYKIDNLIDFQGPFFKPVNLNKATVQGVEVNYNYRNNGLVANINATVQDANNDETNTPLLRRPDNKLNISVDKFFNQFSYGTSIRYASENPDFGIELDGYTVINLRAAYRFNPHWKLSVKVENATDKNYQIINGYNTSGLAGYLSIQWRQ